MEAAQRGVAVSARADGAGDHALALDITLDGGPQFFDHADGFVPDRKPARDGIFALQDMDIGAADGGRRDPDQGIQRPHIRNRLLIEHDPSGLDENGGLHSWHDSPRFWHMPVIGRLGELYQPAHVRY
jgi:hypothetical protein